MNSFRLLLMSCVLLFSTTVTAQEIAVYWLESLKLDSIKTIGFSTLTDMYPWFDNLGHRDSLAAVPDELLGYVDDPDRRYALLNEEYRNRFFNKMNISETDRVFIYDYGADILFEFRVKDVDLVAVLSRYVWKDDMPYPDHYYQIGFEFSTDVLTGMDENYSNVLLYIGDKNPFIRGGLEPMKWEEIDQDLFPSFAQSSRDSAWQAEMDRGATYKCQLKSMEVFIQDLNSVKSLRGRNLVVIDSENGDLIYQTTLYDGESSSSAPLNFTNPNYGDYIYQWVGYLFKHKPTVAFGFQSVSFGCPAIYFLDQSEPPIYIRCDNRH